MKRSKAFSRLIVLTLAATVPVLIPGTAHAAVRTFDNETVGQAPSGTRTYGTATVQNVTVGGVQTRAVRVVDSTSSAQSRVLFLQNGLPAKRFTFDLLAKSTSQSTILAVHGSGASEDTGAWRFLIRPPAAGSTTGVISVYDGTAWRDLATVAGLHNPNAWTRVVIDASATWAGITVAGKQYRTSVRADAAGDITSFEVASSGTQPTGTDTYIDNLDIVSTGSVVATEPAGIEARFPDLIKLADGRMMAVYHSAAGHTEANGVIKLTYSSDNGRTWTPPTVAVSNAYDNRDPKLTQLADGTVLLSFFQTDWTGSGSSNRGSFVARMAPGSTTFATPVRIASNQGGNWLHAPAVEIPGGDVLQPLYGSGAYVARSHDGGRTWDASAEVFAARDNDRYLYQEPNVTRLPSGQLVMLIRSFDKIQNKNVPSFITRSNDDGRTWTPLTQSDITTASHHQLLTSSGALLLTYGDPGVANRPTFGALIADPAGPWTGYPKTLLYNSGHGDQANPTSAEIAPGRYLTMSYNVTTRQLLAFETTTATYR
ncbi:hypothetical protein JOF56_006960 [Kibdelosporangium banguiense]|uniref:Sialidase domain-containing protein n=1 Tax=Kibdelosporangium banguiense TaxID=1365924 RepID=A0ABS4TQ97_9PSEU|nr:sialidase family protein [Kibdelosporangium banguiense]MBP2326575.1 hypothetical protein [Kibdelosporangium banguiense]